MPDWSHLENTLSGEVVTYLEYYSDELFDGGLPELNVPLLRKSVEWAEAESKRPPLDCEWNQSFWGFKTSCGTQYCLAGHVLQEAGYDFVYGAGARIAMYSLSPTGAQGDFSERAADLVGLSRWEASMLFSSENSIEDIKLIANTILERAGDKL